MKSFERRTGLIGRIGRAFRERLGLKMLGAFGAALVVVLLTYTLVAVFRERGKAGEELASTGETLAGLLSYGSRIGVFAENRELLKDVAEGIAKQRHVVLVAIYSADLRTLYTVEKAPAGRYRVRDIAEAAGAMRSEKKPTDVHETADVLEFVRPVVISVFPRAGETLYFGGQGDLTIEKTIGYVRIVLEKETLQEELQGIVTKNAIITLLFIAAGVILVHRRVKRTMAPLEKLTRSVEALGEGGEVEEVTVETIDEIGKLASAFNKMVSRRKRAEEALRESEKKYRTLFEESKDAVFFDSLDDRFIDINPAAVELFGCFSKEHLLALDVKKDLYANPQDREVFKQIMELQGFIKDHEVQMRKQNNDMLNVVMTATTVRDERGRTVGYRGFLRDVTVERSLEQQLRHAQKMEAVGQLSGGIAHDFNNILTAVLNYAELLHISPGMPEPLRKYADNIIVSAQRASNLVSSLLAFSRKQIMNLKPADINDIVKTMRDMLSRIIGEDIELVTSFRDAPLPVIADRGQIEQVLMNFAANARDAMPGGGRLTIETYRTADDEFAKVRGIGASGEYVVLSVADTGMGMDEKTAKKIFDPFFTTKEVGKGTGLGLSIVYGIVKQHNGFIDVASEPGRGTTFMAYLPLVHMDLKHETPGNPEACAGGAETILLAEDNDAVRQSVQSIFGEFGYRLITATDGEDAVRKFMEHRDAISLLFFDVIMPKKNGIQAYEEIKKVRPDMKVVFTSGYIGDINNIRKIDEHRQRFVLKPASPRELLRKVREVLDS